MGVTLSKTLCKRTFTPANTMFLATDKAKQKKSHTHELPHKAMAQNLQS